MTPRNLKRPFDVGEDMVSDSTPRYSCPITLRLIGPESWSDVPAVLCYDADDPYAVRIAFGEPGDVLADGEDGAQDEVDEGITWLVSRELLQAGMHRPAGEGDVRVWPTYATADLLFLHLRAPSGEALFELSRAAVAGFLRLTEELVPSGTELSALDVDEELQALLSGGGADGPAR